MASRSSRRQQGLRLSLGAVVLMGRHQTPRGMYTAGLLQHSWADISSVMTGEASMEVDPEEFSGTFLCKGPLEED